ncbi:cupin domain-containing protein [Fodinicola feengrottensis]|uniref:Cupin domain-containing protein n=1 Tax=Fodinicola feengrottensis TaxID=435914 RepID=A0ABN2FT15_9ACTN
MPVIPAPEKPTHELPGTKFTSLATPSRGSTHLSVWQVEIEPGPEAAPHEVTLEEVFVILNGKASVVLGDRTFSAGAGDAIVVPPDTPFAISNAGQETLRTICCMPVGGQARMADSPAFTPPWAE